MDILSRFNPNAHVVVIHDMWTYGANLEKGDVDDTLNCFHLAKKCKRLTICIVNDTGDNRRYTSFIARHGPTLLSINPYVKIVTGHELDMSDVRKVVLCAPLSVHDDILLQKIRSYNKLCKYYAQGDTPGAYNMNSTLTPYINFNTSTLTVLHDGTPIDVPIKMYNTAATNRKFRIGFLRSFAPSTVIDEMLVYAKHKLCFLPTAPYAIGLLMKKYGTGNTAYGLCHAMNLMELNDTRDPDEVIHAYFKDKWEDAHILIDCRIATYPAVHRYMQTMKTISNGKLDSEEDMDTFKRALCMVVECTLLWFGREALDRFRTLADSDVRANPTGTEQFSPSMFDLVVGVCAMYDLTPQELSELLPGNANSLADGRFFECMV